MDVILYSLQVIHDCRWISDLLGHQHGIFIANVFDTQVGLGTFFSMLLSINPSSVFLRLNRRLLHFCGVIADEYIYIYLYIYLQTDQIRSDLDSLEPPISRLNLSGEQIWKLNRHSLNCSLFSSVIKNGKFNKSWETRSKLNVCVTVTSQSSYNRAHPQAKRVPIICPLDQLSRPSTAVPICDSFALDTRQMTLALSFFWSFISRLLL